MILGVLSPAKSTGAMTTGKIEAAKLRTAGKISVVLLLSGTSMALRMPQKPEHEGQRQKAVSLLRLSFRVPQMRQRRFDFGLEPLDQFFVLLD